MDSPLWIRRMASDRIMLMSTVLIFGHCSFWSSCGIVLVTTTWAGRNRGTGWEEGQPGMNDGVEAGVSPRRWPTPLWTVGHHRRGCRVSPWRRSCRLLVLLESRLRPRNCPHRRWCHPETKILVLGQKKNPWTSTSRRTMTNEPLARKVMKS